MEFSSFFFVYQHKAVDKQSYICIAYFYDTFTYGAFVSFWSL